MSGFQSCIGALLICLLLSACGAGKKPETTAPIQFTVNDLEQFRWLEGTWRGTGTEQNPFYEKYAFEINGTIKTYSFTDSTLIAVSDSGRIYLQNGEVLHEGGGGVWKASQIETDSISFEPVVKFKNSFTWARTTADSWTATLKNPGSPDVVYYMKRFR